MTPGPKVVNYTEVSFGVGMAEPKALSLMQNVKAVFSVIQVVRSDPAFGQPCVMAIQASATHKEGKMS